MIAEITSFLMMFGLKSLFVAKVIEGIGTALPTPLKGLFRKFLAYEVVHLGKIAIIGLPVTITIEMIVGFFIGRLFFGF